MTDLESRGGHGREPRPRPARRHSACRPWRCGRSHRAERSGGMFKPIASRLAISQKTKRRRRPLSISSAALRAVDENGAPRAAIVALTIDVPPTKRRAGLASCGPPVCRRRPCWRSPSQTPVSPCAAPMVLAAEGEQRRRLFLSREVRTGPKQQNAPRRIFRQTRCDDAAARARPHNNDVVMVHRRTSTELLARLRRKRIRPRTVGPSRFNHDGPTLIPVRSRLVARVIQNEG